MKKLIVEYIVRSVRVRDWVCNKKKVLIQLNEYFSEDSWLLKLVPYQDDFDFYFTKDKYKFLKLIKSADYVFSFGISANVDIDDLVCSKLYFGIVGLEFLRNHKLPERIKIYSAQGITSKAIAEYCLSMVLALTINLQHLIHNKYKKKWSQSLLLSERFKALECKKIGIMGIGYNGNAIAKIFKTYGCEVYGYDINRSNNSFIDRWFDIGSKNTFLKESDVIINALPEMKETIGMIDSNSFKLMKKSAIFVNIGRGSTIIERALEVALRNKVISGAAIDTFIKEPLSRRSKLWSINNIIITPHIAGNVNRFIEQIQDDFINKILQG